MNKVHRQWAATDFPINCEQELLLRPEGSCEAHRACQEWKLRSLSFSFCLSYALKTFEDTANSKETSLRIFIWQIMIIRQKSWGTNEKCYKNETESLTIEVITVYFTTWRVLQIFYTEDVACVIVYQLITESGVRQGPLTVRARSLVYFSLRDLTLILSKLLPSSSGEF